MDWQINLEGPDGPPYCSRGKSPAFAAVKCEAQGWLTDAWHACRASATESMMFSGVLEGRGSDVAKWLQSQAFELQLFSFFPCSELPSPVASPIRVRCHLNWFLATPALSICPLFPCSGKM